MNNRDWDKRLKLFISKEVHRFNRLDKYKFYELVIRLIELVLKIIDIWKKYF